MKIHVTDREGGEHEVEATNGWRVMEIIRDAGLPITAECGGACACATCHVYVDPAWVAKLEERGEEENDMLDLAFEVQENSRLSCQIMFDPSLDGLKVTLAPE
ncbi:MAG: 2Fe-2S iron-sulfur cluster binding domain-containing protein [Alphaproteobacteria bacterium]|nr:2Fe-2S iron-sulfur cluster binding domain-containing protein [Alphaproteobacteria bacterium]